MHNNFTLRESRKKYISLFKSSDIEENRLMCDILLCHFLNVSKTFIITEPDFLISDEVNTKILNAINQINFNKPIQYIIGNVNFMGFDFEVTPDVLIPRSDTEVSVLQVIELIGNKECLILDMCTGSGCIGISILQKCLNSKTVMVDLSDKALLVAQKNAFLNKVNMRSDFIQSDFFENIDDIYLNKFDVIISNPPYITSSDINELDPKVKDYEPRLALDGGEDGLIAYRNISSKAGLYLKQNGILVFEVGYNQAEDVAEIMEKNNYTAIQKKADLNNIDRVVWGVFKG